MGYSSEVTYPLIKSVAWRFIRAGVAGGVGAVALQTLTLNADLSNLETYGRAVIAAFVAGFVSAIGLFIRDNFGDRDRSEGSINKLPV